MRIQAGASVKLRVCFMGGRQAGMTALLTILAAGCEVNAVAACDESVKLLTRVYDLPCYGSIKDAGFMEALKSSDILVCVHGREYVGPAALSLPRFGGVNLHPYLYKYKGASPVERAFGDREFKASVGAHRMSDVIDQGEVLIEKFLDVSGAAGPGEVYNMLYPLYCEVTADVITLMRQRL